MNVYDSYIEAGQEMPRREREKFYTALLEYIAYGKEPQLNGTAKVVFMAIRPSIDLSKKRAKAGGKGGSKKEANRQAKGVANDLAENDFATGFATYQNSDLLPAEMSVAKNKNNSSSKKKDTADAVSKEENGDDFFGFLADAQSAWNEQTGQALLAFPTKANMGLRAVYDNGRTIEDVRAVIRKTAGKWEPRYVTPNAVFGDKFEQWLNQPEPEPQAEGWW